MKSHRSSLCCLFPVVVGSALTLVESRAGVLELDGVDSWVEFTNAEGLIPTGAEAFTIEAWINPTSIPAGGKRLYPCARDSELVKQTKHKTMTKRISVILADFQYVFQFHRAVVE